jgi:hypothetical protein
LKFTFTNFVVHKKIKSLPYKKSKPLLLYDDSKSSNNPFILNSLNSLKVISFWRKKAAARSLLSNGGDSIVMRPTERKKIQFFLTSLPFLCEVATTKKKCNDR